MHLSKKWWRSMLNIGTFFQIILFFCHSNYVFFFRFCTVADEGMKTQNTLLFMIIILLIIIIYENPGMVPAMGNYPKWFGKMSPLRRLKATSDEEVLMSYLHCFHKCWFCFHSIDTFYSFVWSDRGWWIDPFQTEHQLLSRFWRGCQYCAVSHWRI